MFLHSWILSMSTRDSAPLSFQRYYFSSLFPLNFSQRETDKTLETLTNICIQQHKSACKLHNTGMCFEQAKNKQWILTNKNISSYLGKIITTCVHASVSSNWTKCISQKACNIIENDKINLKLYAWSHTTCFWYQH